MEHGADPQQLRRLLDGVLTIGSDLDLHSVLHTIIETQGGKTVDEAAAYVLAMKEAKRYRRDVY